MSSTRRFEGKEIQFGESYILPIEQSKVTVSQAKVKKILEETDLKAQEIISTADNQSAEIIQNANNEAARIIEEATQRAQQEYDSIKNQAYEEGFKKGEQDGLQKFANDASEGLKSLDTLANTSFNVKNNIIDSASRDIVELVSVIADKVCHTKFDDEILYNITLNAIKLLNDKEQITIIVSPKLVDNVNKFVPDLKTQIHNLQTLKITEDSSLSSDGVIIETPASRLDSRISAQIEELTQKMLTGGNDGMEQEQIS